MTAADTNAKPVTIKEMMEFARYPPKPGSKYAHADKGEKKKKNRRTGNNNMSSFSKMSNYTINLGVAFIFFNNAAMVFLRAERWNI